MEYNVGKSYNAMDKISTNRKSRKIFRERKNNFTDEEYKLIMNGNSQELIEEKTGLYKPIVIKHFYDKFLEHQKVGDIRKDREIAFCMIDVNKLKCVNDTFGHYAGDEVIEEVAKIIKGNIRPRDLAARFGGDEFHILLVGSSVNDAENVARRIRESIYNSKKISQYGATGSIGLTKARRGEHLEEVVCIADKAMYFAKNNGKNACAMFNNSTFNLI